MNGEIGKYSLLKGGKFDQVGKNQVSVISAASSSKGDAKNEPTHPLLVNCDKELVEKIEADIVHRGQAVTFDDISGLDFAKKCVTELICWFFLTIYRINGLFSNKLSCYTFHRPMSRPDLFRGIRTVPKGILLFGPPGTGDLLQRRYSAPRIFRAYLNINKRENSYWKSNCARDSVDIL